MPVAVVTGANRGIGLAVTEALARRRYTIYAGCRRPGAATDLSAVISSAKHGSVIKMDVADPRSVTAAAQEIFSRSEAVDLLINNAAIGRAAGYPPAAAEGPLAALDGHAIASLLQVNSIGPAIVTQALIPALKRSASGARVVNVTSDLGSLSAEVPEGSYAYAMSKAALNMLTRKLAAEFSPRGIIVAAIHPGSVQTRLGGPAADLLPAQAAETLLDLICTLKPEHTGRAFTPNGDPLPWLQSLTVNTDPRAGARAGSLRSRRAAHGHPEIAQTLRLDMGAGGGARPAV